MPPKRSRGERGNPKAREQHDSNAKFAAIAEKIRAEKKSVRDANEDAVKAMKDARGRGEKPPAAVTKEPDYSAIVNSADFAALTPEQKAELTEMTAKRSSEDLMKEIRFALKEAKRLSKPVDFGDALSGDDFQKMRPEKQAELREAAKRSSEYHALQGVLSSERNNALTFGETPDFNSVFSQGAFTSLLPEEQALLRKEFPTEAPEMTYDDPALDRWKENMKKQFKAMGKDGIDLALETSPEEMKPFLVEYARTLFDGYEGTQPTEGPKKDEPVSEGRAEEKDKVPVPRELILERGRGRNRDKLFVRRRGGERDLEKDPERTFATNIEVSDILPEDGVDRLRKDAEFRKEFMESANEIRALWDERNPWFEMPQVDRELPWDDKEKAAEWIKKHLGGDVLGMEIKFRNERGRPLTRHFNAGEVLGDRLREHLLKMPDTERPGPADREQPEPEETAALRKRWNNWRNAVRRDMMDYLVSMGLKERYGTLADQENAAEEFEVGDEDLEEVKPEPKKPASAPPPPPPPVERKKPKTEDPEHITEIAENALVLDGDPNGDIAETAKVVSAKVRERLEKGSGKPPFDQKMVDAAVRKYFEQAGRDAAEIDAALGGAEAADIGSKDEEKTATEPEPPATPESNETETPAVDRKDELAMFADLTREISNIPALDRMLDGDPADPRTPIPGLRRKIVEELASFFKHDVDALAESGATETVRAAARAQRDALATIGLRFDAAKGFEITDTPRLANLVKQLRRKIAGK